MTSSKLKQPDLTIVIPAYSEEKRIGRTLDELSSYLKKNKLFKDKTVEVVIVVAESGDNTRAIVKSKLKLFRRAKLLEPGPVVGKGRDVKCGVLNASGKIIVFIDADLATPLYYLEKFYKDCTNNSDIVVGTRNLLVYRKGLLRRMFSYTGNVLFKVAGGVWIEDSQCGFKMFDERAAKLCFSKLQILGWRFDMEILAIAKQNKLKIKKYRITDWKDMPHSTFKEGIIKNSLGSLKDLTYIALNRIKRSYLEE